jgi:hypothetical protein
VTKSAVYDPQRTCERWIKDYLSQKGPVRQHVFLRALRAFGRQWRRGGELDAQLIFLEMQRDGKVGPAFIPVAGGARTYRGYDLAPPKPRKPRKKPAPPAAPPPATKGRHHWRSIDEP